MSTSKIIMNEDFIQWDKAPGIENHIQSLTDAND